MKERCRKIYEIICGAKKLSIRQISRMTNIPKSSTQRHKKRIEKRNIFPESHLWETEEGQKFIHRLVIVTILISGVMCGAALVQLHRILVSPFCKSLTDVNKA